MQKLSGMPLSEEEKQMFSVHLKPKKLRRRQYIANTPLGRRGQPEDITKAVIFLASNEAAWITGEQLSVSGGMYGF